MDPRLTELLTLWDQKQKRGEPAAADDHCATCPELLPAFRRVLAERTAASALDSQATMPPAPPIDPLATLPPPSGNAPESVTLPPSIPATTIQAATAMVPGYDILGELGRGGMGVVYKARQQRPQRTVALKMVLAGAHASSQDLMRFLAEAEAIAKLRHANIVQIYEFGKHGEQPYFSLEFCEGGSLAGKLAGTPLKAREAAELIATLAEAVQAAHDAGIVHRDLKPHNVLLLADGTPKITDFGLAKQAGSDLTASGAIMGTPSYMAPEQADPRKGRVGPAADVYALGAVMYECLTGKPPFRAATAIDTIMQVISDEPVAPRRVNPHVPRDLEIITLKCLQKDPTHRYTSAAALCQDLRHYLNGESIIARPAGRLEVVWRRVRRNPTLTGLACAVTGLLILTLILAIRREAPPPVPAVATATASEDEVLKVVADLNRSSPGWRLENLEARRAKPSPERDSALVIAAAQRVLPEDWPVRFHKVGGTLAALKPTVRLTPAQVDAVQTLLAGTEKTRVELRAAADMPDGRHPVNFARDGLTTLLPHAQTTRHLVELLAVDAIDQTLAGRPDQAVVACQTAINVSRSLRDEPTAISQMVRIAGVLAAIRRAEWVLSHGAPTVEELAKLGQALEREANEPILRIMAEGERGMMHWTMSAITAGDFDFGSATLKDDPGLLAALQSIPKGLAARDAHAWLLRQLTRFVDVARLPDHEQIRAMQDWDRLAKTAPNGVRQLLVAAEKLAEASLRHRAATRCAVVALAAERYRLSQGDWPGTFTDLASKLLQEMPNDPFDGKPLRYRKLADGVVVYSVGPDVEDNEGTLETTPTGRPGADIGFRLWDASLRRLPVPP